MNSPKVLISGAGPVGLSLAAALVNKGIDVCVFEAGATLSDEARASTFHPPTLEMFDEWGVLGPILGKGKRIDHLQFWERRSRTLVADFDYGLIARDTPFPYRFQCPQSEVTRVLVPFVEASGHGKVLFNHVVKAARPHGAGVQVDVATNEGTRTFEADFVVGADGSKSAIRASLGLGFTGMTYPDRFLLLATDLDLAPYFPGMGPVSYVFDPDEWVIVMHLPQVVRIVFRLGHEEADSDVNALEPDSMRRRVARFVGQEVPFELKGQSVYSVHQRVVDRFRVGPMLLAGDAAHINNPAGGMGMNSGIHDAHLLASALASVLSGGADRELDAYAEARRHAAVSGVQAKTQRNYADLTAKTEAACEARNRVIRAASTDPEKARAYLLTASMLDTRIAGQGRAPLAKEEARPCL